MTIEAPIENRPCATRQLKIALVCRYWDMIKGRPQHLFEQAVNRGHHVNILAGNGRPWKDLLLACKDIARESRLVTPGDYITLWQRAINHLPMMSRLSLGERFFASFLRSRLRGREKSYDVILYCSDPVPVRGDSFPRESVFVYDCLDDWDGFQGKSRAAIMWERAILKRADLVVSVSDPLSDVLKGRGATARVCVIPNGVNVTDFSCTKRKNEGSKKIIGYVGSVEEWFDWPTVIALAEALPECEMVIVGPVSCSSGSSLLPSNIRLVGRQPYSKISSYLNQFDVGIIPFRSDLPYIKSVSPIKLYEYWAAGLPAVASAMADAMNAREPGVLYVADQGTGFIEATCEALKLSADPVLIRRRREIAEQNTWAKRWQAFEGEIYRLLDGRRSAT